MTSLRISYASPSSPGLALAKIKHPELQTSDGSTGRRGRAGKVAREAEQARGGTLKSKIAKNSRHPDRAAFCLLALARKVTVPDR